MVRSDSICRVFVDSLLIETFKSGLLYYSFMLLTDLLYIKVIANGI